jgi:hypothetical protein
VSGEGSLLRTLISYSFHTSFIISRSLPHSLLARSRSRTKNNNNSDIGSDYVESLLLLDVDVDVDVGDPSVEALLQLAADAEYDDD